MCGYCLRLLRLWRHLCGAWCGCLPGCRFVVLGCCCWLWLRRLSRSGRWLLRRSCLLGCRLRLLRLGRLLRGLRSLWLLLAFPTDPRGDPTIGLSRWWGLTGRNLRHPRGPLTARAIPTLRGRRQLLGIFSRGGLI